MLRFAESLDRLVALEIEDHVAHRVAERQRRVLLRPLPLHAVTLVGDLGLVPAVLEHDVEIVRLRMQVERGNFVRVLSLSSGRSSARGRRSLASRSRARSCLPGVRKLRHEHRAGVLDGLSRLPLCRRNWRPMIVGPHQLAVGVEEVDEDHVVFGERAGRSARRRSDTSFRRRTDRDFDRRSDRRVAARNRDRRCRDRRLGLLRPAAGDRQCGDRERAGAQPHGRNRGIESGMILRNSARVRPHSWHLKRSGWSKREVSSARSRPPTRW